MYTDNKNNKGPFEGTPLQGQGVGKKRGNTEKIKQEMLQNICNKKESIIRNSLKAIK